MNKNQWFTFGMGFMLLGMYLLWTANINGYCDARILNDTQMIFCGMRRYSYSVSGSISGFIGFICLICGGLE